MAELVDRTQEVGGSNPLSSIERTPAPAGVLSFRGSIEAREFWLREP